MVDYIVRGDVALLQVNSPPVNAIGHKVRTGLLDGINRASSDDNIKAVVLSGRGRSFPVGADIKEFDGGFTTGIDLQKLCDIIEACPKPIVAAVHGTALGGGLELMLSCHYRIALSTARFGFPEVTLGILPAAGGTQRLPRIVGLKESLDMITRGQQISASEALKMGLIDKVTKGTLQNVMVEGVMMAKSKVREDLSLRRVSKQCVRKGENVEQVLEEAMKKVQRTAKGVMAPLYCFKALKAAVDSPTFEEGIKIEGQLFRVLITSSQSKALQYAFFAQRVATKWQLPNGISATDTTPLRLEKGAVIGAGTMGAGIVMVLLNCGIPTVLIEQNENFLEKGLKTIQGLYAGSVKLGRMSVKQAKKNFSLLKASLDYHDLKDVDFVIEAAFENMKIKKEIFSKLDNVCKPSTIFCTNTSSLNIDEIASATRRPDKVVGTHFFAPAYYMRLLENVRGKNTSPETIATVMSLGVKMGKVPVLVGNCHGFVGNRMLNCYSAEAAYCVEEGALPHEVDKVIEDFGIPMGPFKVGDMSGTDIGYKIRLELYKNADKSNPLRRDGRRYTPLADRLFELGRLGRKSGKGWYRYSKPGDKEPFVDEDVTKMILEHCKKYDIARRHLTYQEISERCLYAMINEGFKILEEGIVTRPEDIDTIWLNGYGWPRQTGGPMFYANQVGLNRIFERVCHYRVMDPLTHYWVPSNLLRKLSQSNVPMNQWMNGLSSNL